MGFSDIPTYPWASAGTKVDPGSARAAIGFESGDSISPGQMNWLLGELSTYVRDGQWTGDDIKIRGGSGQRMQLQLTTNSFKVEDLDGGSAGVVMEYRPSAPSLDVLAHLITYDGILADPRTSTGYVYGYITDQDITYDLTASAGAWMPGGVPTIHAVYGTAVNAVVVYNLSGGPIAIVAERDAFPHLGENGAHVSDPFEVVSIQGTLDGSPGTDVLVELVQVVRATGVGTAIMSLPSTGTPHTGGPTAFSDNNGGTPLAIDLATNRYKVRMTDSGVTGTTPGGGADDLTVTIRKGAVE